MIDTPIRSLKITRRTFSEAKKCKSGPYDIEFVSRLPPEEKTLVDTLLDCEQEIVDYINAMNLNFRLKGARMIFDPKITSNEDPLDENNPIFAAYQLGMLAWNLRRIRTQIAADNALTMEQGEIIFRLGRELETWRTMVFNKAASETVRKDVNAEEGRVIRYGSEAKRNKRDAALFREVERAINDNPGMTRAAVKEKVGERYGITGASVEKRLQRYKKKVADKS